MKTQNKKEGKYKTKDVVAAHGALSETDSLLLGTDARTCVRKLENGRVFSDYYQRD